MTYSESTWTPVHVVKKHLLIEEVREKIVLEYIKLVHEYVNLPIDVDTPKQYVPIQTRKNYLLKRIETLKIKLNDTNNDLKELEEKNNAKRIRQC